jgi:hypothetical protein
MQLLFGCVLLLKGSTIDGTFQCRDSRMNLPRRIRRLGGWSITCGGFNPDAQRLFIRIDRELWERTKHNPIRFLQVVPRASLNAVTQDRYYLELYDRIFRAFDLFMKARETWCSRHHPEYTNRPIAYFSTEFGLHETLPIYAGGLGVLSGDHLKGASDLGIPIVAVSSLYAWILQPAYHRRWLARASIYAPEVRRFTSLAYPHGNWRARHDLG